LGRSKPLSGGLAVIYAWTGDGYNNVSNTYRSYYEQRLDSLRTQIAAIESIRERAQVPAAKQDSQPETTVYHDLKVVRGLAGPDEDNPPEQEAPSPVASPTLLPDLGNADCIEAEAGKIERFLGSKDAGMENAIQWANSNDPFTRDFATAVLFDIGTSDAAGYLRTLSNDSSDMVAKNAKMFLSSLASGGREAHKIELREDLARPQSE
jgi:hypothetical protein